MSNGCRRVCTAGCSSGGCRAWCGLLRQRSWPSPPSSAALRGRGGRGRRHLPASTRVVPADQIVGMWKGTDPAFPYLMVLRADGSQDTMTLGDPSLSWTDTHAFWQSLPGENLALNDVLDPRADCRFGFTGQWQAEGVIRLTQVDQAGTGCGSDVQPHSFTMIRISPASPPGRGYTAAATDDQLTPVTDIPSLWGAWLLRGTGVVLAVNPTAPPNVFYTIGANGDVGKGADDHGRFAVPALGRVILKSTDSTGCPDTILQNVSAGFYSFTAQVESDPCHRFGGQTELTWTRLQ